MLDDEKGVPNELKRKIGGTISDDVGTSGQGFSREIVLAMLVLIRIING